MVGGFANSRCCDAWQMSVVAILADFPWDLQAELRQNSDGRMLDVPSETSVLSEGGKVQGRSHSWPQEAQAEGEVQEEGMESIMISMIMKIRTIKSSLSLAVSFCVYIFERTNFRSFFSWRESWIDSYLCINLFCSSVHSLASGLNWRFLYLPKCCEHC